MHGDLVAAARVLFGLPAARRNAAIGQLLRQAGWADRHRRKTGKLHPIWGDGSLMSAALNRRPGPEPSLDDPVYCACMALVLDALVDWRSVNGPGRRPRRSKPWDRVPAD